MIEELPGGVEACATPCPHASVSLQAILDRFARAAHQGVCDTGRYRCPYFVWGHGPPLLCIPGLADDACSFVQLSYRLSDHFQCIAYDLPAGGRDGACLSRYSQPDLAADVFALLDHLQVRQSCLFGSSFGSTVALAAMHAN